MDNAVALKEDISISKEDIKKYIAPNATDKELFMFMGIAKSYGLNPLKREIHFVKYGTSPASVIVGYEIYLKRAERTGKLDGWKCWIEGDKAVIEIKRKDHSIPVKWEVDRKEFDKQQSTWKSMPNFMLKKVAIAQGFRLAFPDELGGLPYLAEELPNTAKISSEELSKDEIIIDAVEAKSQDDVPDFAPPPSIAPEEKTPPSQSSQATDGKITQPQVKRMFAVSKESGINTDQLKQFLMHFYSYEHSTDITKAHYNEIVGILGSRERFDALMETIK